MPLAGDLHHLHSISHAVLQIPRLCLRPQVREVVDTENIPKGFFIGQPTRKGTYGMPGCTFGEQFGGASGDVFKYTAEPCSELAKRDSERKVGRGLFVYHTAWYSCRTCFVAHTRSPAELFLFSLVLIFLFLHRSNGKERAYARQKRGERPSFRPASGHADSGKQVRPLLRLNSRSSAHVLLLATRPPAASKVLANPQTCLRCATRDTMCARSMRCICRRTTTETNCRTTTPRRAASTWGGGPRVPRPSW